MESDRDEPAYDSDQQREREQVPRFIGKMPQNERTNGSTHGCRLQADLCDSRTSLASPGAEFGV